MNLDELTLEQKKAMAFDESRKMDTARNNFQALSQAIRAEEQKIADEREEAEKNLNAGSRDARQQ